jgi:hypothetical protein
VLLHAVGAVEDLSDALDLPLGVAAAAAAALYAATFSGAVQTVLACSTCGALLDLTVPLAAAAEPPDRDSATVHVASRTVVVRAPTTRDLLVAAAAADPCAALLGCCVSESDGSAVDAADLPADLRGAVDAVAEELSGPASLLVSATCPECADTVRGSVDVVGLLWERIHLAAPSVLVEVAELAAAFGWREPDVLALSPLRRQAYLDLVRAGST